MKILGSRFSQVFAYVINRWLCLRYLIGAFDDNGGSCTIHVFGAFFGLFVSKFGSNKDADNNPDNSSRYNRLGFCICTLHRLCLMLMNLRSDIFSIVGSIMMWLTFPSFNGFMAPTQARSAVMVHISAHHWHCQTQHVFIDSLFLGEHFARPHLRRRVCVCIFRSGQS